MKKEIIYIDDITKKPVASLKETDNGLFLKYDSDWLGNSLDPAIPLSFSGILNKWQIDGLIDRLPVKTNPRYSEYCERWEISIDESDTLTLLCTIGHRTTSSSVCSPVGWAPGLWKNKIV